MDWLQFQNKFHKSWHTSIKKWVESKESAKVYAFLKSQKGKEIAPLANLTFRTFEQDLSNVKVVVLLEEPYCEKNGNTQFADGIPLSCEYVNKIHPQLNEFYNAMEREFYGLNLNIIKNKDIKYLTDQGVLFLSSSLTSEIGSPGKHNKLWESFTGHIIKSVFCKKNIPIIFCGEKLFQQYRFYLEPLFPYFVVKQSLSDWTIGKQWDTEGKFSLFNKYIWDKTQETEIMWVQQDVPF